MSWAAVGLLCGAAYAIKAIGAFVAGRAEQGTAPGGSLDVLVIPVIAGLIVVQTIGTGQSIGLDARLPAVLVAGVLVWRRLPLLAVVAAAAGTAALLHLAGL